MRLKFGDDPDEYSGSMHPASLSPPLRVLLRPIKPSASPVASSTTGSKGAQPDPETSVASVVPAIPQADSVDRVEEDWRATVTLHDKARMGRLRHALDEHEVGEEASDRLGGRVAVSEGVDCLFLYTDTREAAREAEGVVRQILLAHDLDADFALDRWHPIEERWENERVPLPRTDAERQAEHEHLEEDEIAESEKLGVALWEVRVELDSHHEAVALAERLQGESDALLPGWTCSVVRRWKYLLIGADTEDQANQIAEHLTGRLPAGATIHVEPSGGLAWQTTGRNPFVVFGGLGT